MRALDLLVGVVEIGSLAGAARTREITQPAASVQLRNLERVMGLQLLTRSTRGSAPTPHGEVVAGWARRLLNEAAQFQQAVAALTSSAERRLRVIASYTNAEHVLPRWLASLNDSVPGAVVALEVANSENVVVRVLGGEFELGFVESLHRVDGLEYSKVAEDDLVVVTAPEHPWARRPYVSPQTIADTRLITRELGSGTRTVYEEAIRRRGLTTTAPLLELGSTSAVLAAVRRGDAPAVVSRIAAQPYLDADVLVRVEVPELDLSRDLHAVWPKEQQLSSLARTLLERLTRTEQ